MTLNCDEKLVFRNSDSTLACATPTSEFRTEGNAAGREIEGQASQLRYPDPAVRAGTKKTYSAAMMLPDKIELYVQTD